MKMAFHSGLVIGLLLGASGVGLAVLMFEIVRVLG